MAKLNLDKLIDHLLRDFSSKFILTASVLYCRYFIIIDDIWDIDTWKTLDSALCKNSHGCVIMTTTRMYNVAKECCLSNGNLVYKMQPLSIGDSRKLFFKGIFGCEKCPSDFEKVSDDI